MPGVSGPAVCLYTESREPSGLGEHMLALALALRPTCRLALVCPAVPAAQPYLQRAAEAAIPTFSTVPCGDEADARLVEWLRARRVDVFHLHAGIAWEGHGAPALARAAGIRVSVRTEHLPYLLTTPRDRVAYDRAWRRHDRIVCVSEAARRSFVVAGVAPETTVVIRNGIAPRRSRLARSAARERLGLADGTPMILTVARFTEQKNHRALLAAIPRVRARAPDVRFAWVGSGPLEAELRAAIHGGGLDESVRVLGSRDDVPELLAAADLFVLPSRFEGLPLAPLEAMAAGLPVVATRACGTDEVVVDGETGLIVEPDEPAALARAILDVLEHREWGRRLGAAGRARVAEAFTVAPMARATRALYEQLLAGAHAAA
jgi:glycosyltransferase involved in cell wall biosynthesis